MKYAIGQLVVCSRTNEEQFSYLVGAVGEVKQHLPALEAWLTQADYAVDFPIFHDARCNSCGEKHGGVYVMAENELKPLDDPDKDTETETDEELDFGFSNDVWA